MSTTSHNVQYKTNTIVQPTSTTAELRKRAWVNKAEIELYNIQAWVHLVYKCYEQVINTNYYWFFLLLTNLT